MIVVILHQKATYGMVKGITHVSLIFSKQISLNKLLICFYNRIILEAVFHCRENFSGWEWRVTKNRSTGIFWRGINSFSRLQDGRRKICLLLYWRENFLWKHWQISYYTNYTLTKLQCTPLLLNIWCNEQFLFNLKGTQSQKSDNCILPNSYWFHCFLLILPELGRKCVINKGAEEEFPVTWECCSNTGLLKDKWQQDWG